MGSPFEELPPLSKRVRKICALTKIGRSDSGGSEEVNKKKCFPGIISSFNKLMSIYYMLCSVLGSGATSVNKTRQNSIPIRNSLQEKEMPML